MSDLPRLVQRAPQFLYVAAILFFVASVVLTHLQLANSFQSTGDTAGTMESYTRLTLFNAWLQAAEGSLYLLANGVMVQVLLGIWRNTRCAEPPEDGE